MHTTSQLSLRLHPAFVLLTALLVVLVVGGLGGCDSGKASDKSLLFVTVDQGQKLAAGERSLLGKHSAATWVDARTHEDYDAGHIPGAISLPFERVTADHFIVKDKPIVIVYGADFNDARANGMSKRLKELLEGHDIRTLDGGIRAWTAAGNELERTDGSTVTTAPTATAPTRQ